MYRTGTVDRRASSSDTLPNQKRASGPRPRGGHDEQVGPDRLDVPGNRVGDRAGQHDPTRLNGGNRRDASDNAADVLACPLDQLAIQRLVVPHGMLPRDTGDGHVNAHDVKSRIVATGQADRCGQRVLRAI
jgi:hypothetical protein